MRTDNFISPTSEGSSRHGEFHQFPCISAGANLGTTFFTKNGRNFSAITVDAWGFGAEAATRTTRFGGVCWQKRQGGVFFDFNIPLVTVQPGISRWRDGLYVIEFVGSWPFATTTGVEYGLVFGFQDVLANLRPISVANQGFAVYSDLGILRFGVRGPQGLVVTNLAGTLGASLDQFQLIRVELRSATVQSPCSVKVFVNGLGSPSATILGNNANFPVQGAAGTNASIRWGFGAASATDYFLFRDIGFWAGPDTPIGM